MAKGDIKAKNAGGTLESLAVGTDGKVLMADAASTLGVKWETAGGTGDVTGPASSTDHMIAVFNGTSGKAIETIAVPTATTQYLKCASTGPPVTYEWSAPSASVTNYPAPDYFFFNDSGTYKALNTRTGAVDYSGATCHTVLQSTVNNIQSTWGHGAVYFRPGDSFTFTGGVSHAFGTGGGGIFLFSNGAHLDISGYNGTIFDFGSDSYFRTVGDASTPAYLTGISGFSVEGLNAMTNTSEKLMVIRNMCDVALVENIKFAYVYNLVEIRGGSYSAIIRGVVGAYCPGTWVKFTYTATGGVPNASNVTDSQISNGSGATYATSIGIDNGGGEGTYATGIVMSGNWIENNNIGIRDGGNATVISNNVISADQGTAPKNIHLISTAYNTIISNNHLTTAPSTGYGIYTDATGNVQSKCQVIGNDFGYSTGTCIYNAVSGTGYGTLDIVGNDVVFDSSGAGVFFSGDLLYSNISGNRVNGGNSSSSTTINLGANSSSSTIVGNFIRGYSNTTTTLISGTGAYINISGNTLARATVGVVVTNLTYSLIAENVITDTVTTEISGTPGTGTHLRDNVGDASMAKTYHSVIGPASSTDNAIARFDLATGKIIQDSAVTIADTTGNMAGVGTLGCGAITSSGAFSCGSNTLASGTQTITGNNNPEADNTRSLGINGTGWGRLYLGAATTAKVQAGTTVAFRNHADSADQSISTAGITHSADIVPASDNSRSMGSAAASYANIYLGTANQIRSDSDIQFKDEGGSTYQDIDALSLKIGGTTVINSSGIVSNQVVGLTYVIDGGGSAITTGSKGFLEVPFAMTVTGWTILANASGSIVVDVHRCTYSGFPTTTTIAGTELPTLSTAQKNQDLSLSSWTTSLAAGDILEFIVDSASTVQRVTVSIRGTRA